MKLREGALMVLVAVLAITGLGLALLHNPPSASTSSRSGVASPSPAGFVVGLHVPWAIGGPRIERNGELVQRSAEWPDARIPAVRLWDTRTAWLNLEQAQDQWDFTALDAHVAAALDNGTTDINLVLWGTPTWAASSLSSTDAAWMGPGSAAMPRSLEDWVDYVSTVATRYRGQITSYSIGNETNVKTFWRGTQAELVSLVDSGARAIKAADPQAQVVAGGEVLAGLDTASITRLGSYWRDLAQRQSPIDALSFHWYPPEEVRPKRLLGIVKALRTEARRAGVGATPLWLTEVNHYVGGALTDRQFVLRTHKYALQAQQQNGLERMYWYAWMDLGEPEFMQIYQGTAAERAILRTMNS